MQKFPQQIDKKKQIGKKSKIWLNAKPLQNKNSQYLAKKYMTKKFHRNKM